MLPGPMHTRACKQPTCGAASQSAAPLLLLLVRCAAPAAAVDTCKQKAMTTQHQPAGVLEELSANTRHCSLHAQSGQHPRSGNPPC